MEKKFEFDAGTPEDVARLRKMIRGGVLREPENAQKPEEAASKRRPKRRGKRRRHPALARRRR